MKVLFLTSRLPYPPVGGDRLKSHWLLKILSKHHKVHLVSIVENSVPEGFYSWANETGITYKIFFKKKIHFYKNALRYLFNKLPVQVNYYYFKDVQKYVDSLCRDYDLIISILIRTSNYVINKRCPKILEITDSIGINYKRAKEKTTSIRWRIIYKMEAKRLLDYEKYCISTFDKTLFVNKEEMNYFEEPYKTVWMPNGVNEQLLSYDKTNEKYGSWVVFFGKMDYQPNIDAILWFINNVLPLLNVNLKFAIVGANPAACIKKIKGRYSNVVVTGFVEDPYEILKSSLCIVAPMQTGAGIQNKILESMALGTINIVSSLSAKPINAQDKRDLLIIDDPSEMAKVINDIFINPDKYRYIKMNSREFIKSHFTWGIYENKLLRLIEEVTRS